MKRIPLHGKYGRCHFALVSDEDYELLSAHKWYRQKRGYVKRTDGRSTIYMHRVVINAPARVGVDHRNNNKLDNRRSNLRLANQSQNIANSKPRAGTSKFKGVYLREPGKWVARITHNYQGRHIGVFDTELEAASAYDEVARELFGRYAQLNLERS